MLLPCVLGLLLTSIQVPFQMAYLGRSTSTGRPAQSLATLPVLSRSRNCFPVSASGATSSHVIASG